MTIKFDIGKSYLTRFLGDSESRLVYKVTKRTDKSVWVQFEDEPEVKSYRVKEYDGAEIITLGRYSMAPSLRAEKACPAYEPDRPVTVYCTDERILPTNRSFEAIAKVYWAWTPMGTEYRTQRYVIDGVGYDGDSDLFLEF